MTLGKFKEYVEGLEPNHTFIHSLEGPFSWRGSYDECAFSIAEKPCTPKEILGKIQEALTGTFYGYKGGEYRFYESTPVNFEDSTRSWSDGEYCAEWISKLEKGEKFESQEHRLLSLLFPNL